MTRIRSLAASACFCALVTSAGGCVSGMRYKVPMPSSLTLGTVREENATVAAGQMRHVAPGPDAEARGAMAQPHQVPHQTETSSGVAVLR